MLIKILTSIVFLFICGCDRSNTKDALPTSMDVSPSPKDASPTSEIWARLPHEQWPQLVLTNSAKFKGHSPLNGASGFLIRTEAGKILAATARHLLGENGGVEPEVSLADLDANFDSWVMYPRTLPDHGVKLLGSASKTNGPKNNDWVLLRVDGEPTHVTPLRIRRDPVKVGERVHLVGVSYAEPDVVQKVYSGVVTARGGGNRFRYDISPHVDIRGFSGAPVVDNAGLLVGVMTVWFQPRMNGELYTEAGGEDAAGALAIMKIGE
jgi:Trypsin-like peptidase domain